MFSVYGAMLAPAAPAEAHPRRYVIARTPARDVVVDGVAYAERCAPGLRNVSGRTGHLHRYRRGVLTGNLRTRHDVVGLDFDLRGRPVRAGALRNSLQRR